MSYTNTVKYLAQYSEPTANEIAEKFLLINKHKRYQNVLTIPAYKEDAAFFIRLKNKLLTRHAILLIIVVNQPDSTNNTIVDTQKNQQLWDSIHQLCEHDQAHKHCSFLSFDRSGIILVDCFSEGQQLPEKQGVGLARKIACDIACHFISENIIKSQWIHSTDADTTLPDNYFSSFNEKMKKQTNHEYAAAIYPFTHVGDKTEINAATQLYEKALHYYVSGLQWAGSRYAFHTIGSCIAINAKYYADARGYPKRAGGEDFYLLNKLTKLADIFTLNEAKILIESRLSDRVPFGTGPATRKILEGTNFTYYQPRVFLALKNIIAKSDTLFHEKNSPNKWLTQFDEKSQLALTAIGIDKFFNHLSTHINDTQQCQRHFCDWLDAFKTLKLIHSLEQFYPKIPLNQAISEFDELKAKNHKPIKAQRPPQRH